MAMGPDGLRGRAGPLPTDPREDASLSAELKLLKEEADRRLAEWRGRDALRGREVSWEKGSGVAEGIDERGYLVVRLADDDRVALGAGDVHLKSF